MGGIRAGASRWLFVWLFWLGRLSVRGRQPARVDSRSDSQHPVWVSRTSPSSPPHQWQVQFSYQYSDTNDFYVVDQRNDAAAPFGYPPQRTINLFDLDIIYGLSNRFSVDLTVPFSSGSGEIPMGSRNLHSLYTFHTAGVGDISLQAEYWLSDPTKPSRVTGSVGLGIQAPTGSDSVSGTVTLLPATCRDRSMRPSSPALEAGPCS